MYEIMEMEQDGKEKNMSALEKKVDALLRFCTADTVEAQSRCRRDLQYLLTVETADEARHRRDRIDRVLADLGVPDHLKGYAYLQTAIEICLQNPDAIYHLGLFLYPAVAQYYDTRVPLVERGIRSAIECGWTRCELEMQDRYFGGKVDPSRGKPTNLEFLARVSNVLRRQKL